MSQKFPLTPTQGGSQFKMGITMPPKQECAPAPATDDSGGGGSGSGPLEVVCVPGSDSGGGQYYHNRFIIYVKDADSDFAVDWAAVADPSDGNYFFGMPDDRVDVSFFKGPAMCGGYFGNTAPLTLTITAKHDGIDLGDDLILEFPLTCSTGPDPTA